MQTLDEYEYLVSEIRANLKDLQRQLYRTIYNDLSKMTSEQVLDRMDILQDMVNKSEKL